LDCFGPLELPFGAEGDLLSFVPVRKGPVQLHREVRGWPDGRRHVRWQSGRDWQGLLVPWLECTGGGLLVAALLAGSGCLGRAALHQVPAGMKAQE